MSRSSKSTGKDGDPIEQMLGLARYHREHERFHSMNGLDNALQLRRDSNALKVLADTLLRGPDTAADRDDVDYSDPQFRAVGCEDLSDPIAVATTGILFMEGEGEPRELTQLKGKLWAISDAFGRVSTWLGEKMDAGWPREERLLTPELASAARPRFVALTRTSMSAARYGIVARLMSAALHALNTVDFEPQALRKDRRGAGMLVRTAAWLLDEAAALLAQQAADLGLSDPDWTAYIEELEALHERELGSSSGGSEGGDAAP